ncbi:MAG: hypothetical protein HC901_03735 [Bdellovibrionaceae bacterium]|nr:hypothetical protein [Pseudobdellovibrionaceae bacterium]
MPLIRKKLENNEKLTDKEILALTSQKWMHYLVKVKRSGVVNIPLPAAAPAS